MRFPVEAELEWDLVMLWTLGEVEQFSGCICFLVSMCERNFQNPAMAEC